jgi:hypothetical protein
MNPQHAQCDVACKPIDLRGEMPEAELNPFREVASKNRFALLASPQAERCRIGLGRDALTDPLA